MGGPLVAGADPCIAAREGGRVHAMLANADGYGRACGGQTGTAELEAGLVWQVQSALAARGYDPGPADGVMGASTHSAIAA